MSEWERVRCIVPVRLAHHEAWLRVWAHLAPSLPLLPSPLPPLSNLLLQHLFGLRLCLALPHPHPLNLAELPELLELAVLTTPPWKRPEETRSTRLRDAGSSSQCSFKNEPSCIAQTTECAFGQALNQRLPCIGSVRGSSRGFIEPKINIRYTSDQIQITCILKVCFCTSRP